MELYYVLFMDKTYIYTKCLKYVWKEYQLQNSNYLRKEGERKRMGE